MEGSEKSDDYKPLAGKKVLITAGRTEEPLDPIRYTSKDNGKSGKFCVKAEKQAAGNLPDGSLFGKAFHESKD